MEVGKIMSKKVHTIGPDSSLKECAEILKKTGVNGLVVTEGDKVLGIITKTDLFKVILPRYPENFEEEKHMSDVEYIEERIDKLFKMHVKDIMGAPPIKLHSKAPVIRAGSLMMLRRVKQIPIVDDEKLVGIVTLTDIIHNVSERF